MTVAEMRAGIERMVGLIKLERRGKHHPHWWHVSAEDADLVIIYRFNERAAADFKSGPSFSTVYHIGDSPGRAIKNLHRVLTDPANRIERCAERPIPFIKEVWAKVGIEVGIQ